MNSKAGFIAILGRPNVGKSSFLNQVLGQKLQAVSPKPQTTRKNFLGIYTETINGVDTQMVFVDTPGVHKAKDSKRLNKILIQQASSALDDIDVLIYMIDASRPLKLSEKNTDEALAMEIVKEAQQKQNFILFLVANKMDLCERPEELKLQLTQLNENLQAKAIFPLIAKTGKGVESLLTEISQSLPEHPFYYDADQLSDANMRAIVQEKIQEQLFYDLGEELPYHCCVELTDFKEPKENKKKTEVHAKIHVDRDSQKSMIIGKRGQKIKSIGIAARSKLEKLMEQPVVLKLQVTVSPNWMKDVQFLERVGYHLGKTRERQHG